MNPEVLTERHWEFPACPDIQPGNRHWEQAPAGRTRGGLSVLGVELGCSRRGDRRAAAAASAQPSVSARHWKRLLTAAWADQSPPLGKQPERRGVGFALY